MNKTSSQGSEILAICQRLGLTWAQLAELVPMKSETMRKVVKGYQPASVRIMQQIRNVEPLLKLSRNESASLSASTPSAYGIMKLETLQRNFGEVAEQLQHAGPPDRRGLLSNLRAMLDELEQRERSASPSARGTLTEAQTIAVQASENLDRARAPETPSAPEEGPRSAGDVQPAEPAD
ncbi:MAG: hypothetical protein ABSH48_02480 [Verrucomicrobiota bacterium]|jgi:hypothetical protein